MCDFLLVINSNFGPILHLFCDTAPYWQFGRKLRIFHTPLLIGVPLPMLPFEFHNEVKRQETRVMELLCSKGCMIQPL